MRFPPASPIAALFLMHCVPAAARRHQAERDGGGESFEAYAERVGNERGEGECAI